jgi:ATP-dependent exoDNAse (exonuclease V) beta subunit
MNIRVITASAGSGKTWRLTQELDDAIAAGRARPGGIVAMTFTTQAAAELTERARARLLRGGRGREAHELLAARIGTVNAVCGSLLVEFAFELGLSPAMRVLDDAAADVEFRRALARVVMDAPGGELDGFKAKFESDRDWQADVRRIVEAARANGVRAEQLAACAARSIAELDACLGPVTTSDLDRDLSDAISAALGAIDVAVDDTKGTRDYVNLIRTSANDLVNARGLRWGAWATLSKETPTKKSLEHAAAVQNAARRHVEHPRLRADLHRLITLQFEVAADALAAYQDHKRTRGVIDFIDQETRALELLRDPEVRAALAGQIDLFLVDEFQDTSPIQLALFLELAELATETIWVGDPKQAIYGFRGTDPSLMDAAVESLTSTMHDAELIEDAARTVGGGRVDTLTTSYRSRPGLVELTSEIFARAFASQGMAEDRTRLNAALHTEPAGLGELIEHWPIELDRSAGTDNERGCAGAVAAAVRDLITRGGIVRDGAVTRCAQRRDIAVLCRTNKQCQAVADALAALAVPAVVPRMSLLATTEAQVVRAGLALWVDPGDTVAAAELARIISYPTDLDAFVARVLDAPGRDAFRADPAVAHLIEAREADRDLGPVAAIDAVIAATDLRGLCAGWGDCAQRLANLDALRAHAATFVRVSGQAGGAATVAGLLRYLEALAPAFLGWVQTRTDRQALLAGEDAVTISTWHRAKGLEWPITVLFGLESVREPSSFGVHVLTDRTAFDVADPLGGRWIRSWPNPYTTSNQNGPVRQAFERSPAHATLVAKANREALRVLYVGWTRARDRLVLTAKRGKLLAGIVGTLTRIDTSLINEPQATVAGVQPVRWASIDLSIRVAPARPAPPVAAPREPGMITIGRPPELRFHARATPSTALAVPCTLGEVVILGPRIAVTGNPEMAAIGDAVHSFFAADASDLDDAARLALASELLSSFSVAEHLAPSDVVAMASRLWTWIASRFPTARLHREWPIAHRLETDTIVAGTADLVLAHDAGFTVIDHKSFPGTSEAAAERALGYSGQLAAYANAIRAATGANVTSTWIHFPVRGRLVEVRLREECVE